MAFTYDLASSDLAVVLISKIRLAIGDTVEGHGPRPDGENSNFSDAELLSFYADEGSHRQRAVAAALETLAAEWSAHAGAYKLGPESDTSQQAAEFARRAKELRDRYGYGAEAAVHAGFSVATRPRGRQ